MGIFGRSQKTVFKPSLYQPGKRSRRMPRWLVLLLIGIGLGAGGVLFLQANYGPQRLTVEQSEQLHSELSAANLDRQRLQGELDSTQTQLDKTNQTQAQSNEELAQARARLAAHDQEVALFLDAMPPDPRGGDIGVRAARFQRQDGKLDYRVLVMRENDKAPPFEGTIDLAIEGTYANGRRDRYTPDPLPLTLSNYQHAVGELTPPEGFTPRTVVIRVLDAQKRQHAMRIYNVRP